MLPLYRRQSTEPNCCTLQWTQLFICQDNNIFIMLSLNSGDSIFFYQATQAIDIATVSDRWLFWRGGLVGSPDSTVLLMLTLAVMLEGLYLMSL